MESDSEFHRDCGQLRRPYQISQLLINYMLPVPTPTTASNLELITCNYSMGRGVTNLSYSKTDSLHARNNVSNWAQSVVLHVRPR